METSIFTRIINGDIPCHKVYEDDSVIAFLDIHPAASGHTLVVSKQQIDYFWDLPDEDYAALFEAVKYLAPKLKDIFEKKRTVLKIEGFDVPHTHVHLIPADSSSDIQKQDLNSEPDHTTLAVIASKIKENL